MADKEITDKADAVKNQKKADSSMKKQAKKKPVKKKSAKKKVVKKKIVKKKSAVNKGTAAAKKAEQKQAAPPIVDAEPSAITHEKESESAEAVKNSATVAKQAEPKQATSPKVDAEPSAITRQEESGSAGTATAGNAPDSPPVNSSNSVERGIETPQVSTQTQSNREEHETMSATNAQSQSTAAKGAMGFWPKTLIWIIIVIAGFMYIRSLAEREQTAATPEEQVSSSPETMQTAVEPTITAPSETPEQAKEESTPVEPAVVIPAESQQTVAAPAQLPVAEVAVEAPPAEEQKPGPVESVVTTVPAEVQVQPEAPMESAAVSETGVDGVTAVTVEAAETQAAETVKPAEAAEASAECVAETAAAGPASDKTESTEPPATAPVIAEQTEPTAAAMDESAQPVPAETSSEEQLTEKNARSHPSFRELFGYKRPGSPYRSSRFSRPPGPMGYGDPSAAEGDEAGFPPRQPASRMYGPGPMGYGRGYGYPPNSGYGYPSNQGYGYGYRGYSPYNQMPVR